MSDLKNVEKMFKDGKITEATYKAIIGDFKESKTITRKESKKAIEKIPEPKVEKAKKQKEPKKKVPSVVDTQVIGSPGTSTRTSMYSRKKRPIVKEKTLEPENLSDKESSGEEEIESPTPESLVRKKKRVEEDTT